MHKSLLAVYVVCMMFCSGCGEQIDVVMVAIPGGTFYMGCSEGDTECRDDELPRHEVTLSPFQMADTEVTRGQWKAVMGYDPSEFVLCDDCPVDNVPWDDVQEFIRRLNLRSGKKYRLPTEAEWEYAARAGYEDKYGGCGSDTSCLDDMAWFIENSDEHSQPVRGKKPNDFGLYGMYGNVAEWCWDRYDEDYYENSPAVDPRGPNWASMRVYRGGTWGSYRTGRDWYASYRKRDGAYTNDRGFRLCMDAQ